MRARVSSFLIALAMIAASAFGGEAAGPTVIPRVDEFIDAPRTLFGKHLDEIEQRLGKPLGVRARSATTAATTNTGASLELAYPGVVIEVAPSRALQRVVITEGRYRLPLGLNLGVSRNQVEEILGEPQDATDLRSMYLYSDGFPDTVEFAFRDGNVHRIEWSYSTGDQPR